MKNLILATLTIAATYLPGVAQIYVYDIVPDATVTEWSNYEIKPTGSGGSGVGNYLEIWLHPVPEVVATCWNDCQLLFSGAYPAKLNSGDDINPGGTWSAASYDTLNSMGYGHWQAGATDKYLAFRFKNGSPGWHYGWLKMSVDPAATSFTLKEWGYHTVAGNSIKAGQKNATGISEMTEDDQISLTLNNHQLSIANLPGKSTCRVNIMALNGTVLQQAAIAAGESMDISGLATGAYIVLLQGADFRKAVRIAYTR